MLNRVTAFGIGLVMLSAGLAYAGEPTGRYNGADGSSPDGAEQVQFANFGNATNSHYMPSDADNIPMGSVPAATADSGTMTHYSPADTAALPPANAKPGASDLAASGK
jgi:hypothetical protein